MKTKNTFNLIYAVFAIIIGMALYKNFDMITGKFRNMPLAIIYFVTIVILLSLLVKNFRKNREI